MRRNYILQLGENEKKIRTSDILQTESELWGKGTRR